MRFHSVDIDDCERPTVMDRVVEAIGGEALDRTHKSDCCGASLSITRPDITRRLLKDFLDSAQRAGADDMALRKLMIDPAPLLRGKALL